MSSQDSILDEIKQEVAQLVYERESLDSTVPGELSPLLDWDSLQGSSKSKRIQRTSSITEIVVDTVVDHLVAELEKLYKQQSKVSSTGEMITDSCKEFYNSAVGDSIAEIQKAKTRE